MINWDEELKKIFADPLLADVTAPKRKVKASDRLIAGFQNIVEFVETNRRLPQNCDKREERALYNQLKGILNDSKKKKRCKVYDIQYKMCRILKKIILIRNFLSMRKMWKVA